MKRFLVFFLLISSISYSQQVKKIRNIDLEFPLMEIEEDYGLKVKGKVIPIQLNKKQYDQRAKRGSTELATELKIESFTSFDKNLQKVNLSKVTMRGTTTTYNFQYDSQGRLKKYWSEGGRYGDTFESYTYQGEGNFTRTKSFKEGDAGIKYIYKKTDYGYLVGGDDTKKKLFAKNNLVNKIVLGYDRNEPSETLIEHDKNGKVSKRETSFAIQIYQYNSNGDQTFFQETNKLNGSTTSRTYAYKYDKYGNWVIQVSLLDMSMAKGIPSFPNPTLREIKYSNGEVTGTTDISQVESDLVALRKAVRSVDINTDNQVATWKRSSKDNFKFYLDNQSVNKAMLAYMGPNILAFNQDNNKLYVMKDAKNASLNKTYNATKLSIVTSNGYWFKHPNGGVTVFTNRGEIIKKNTLYKYAPNNIDVFYQGEGQANKIVLKGYKNAQTYTVYPAIAFNQYNPNKKNITTNTNANTTAKKAGTCLKGDCENGYGEFKHTNGYMSEGFFKNGAPNGPMHVSLEKDNESSIAFLQGNYKSYKGMQYRFSDNRFTEMIDYNKGMGLMNDAKERKSYIYNFKNGKVVSKTLLQERTSTGTGCIVGNCTNGAGVYKYSNGTFYFGYFKNGRRNGFGRLDLKDGKQYFGEFDMGTYSGMGTYIISQYNYYIGEFANNTFNGQGVMYYSKTSYKAGYWKGGHYQGKSLATNNYTKQNSNTNKKTTYTSTNSKTNATVKAKTSDFNTLSSYDKGSLELCKTNSRCVATFFDKLYEKTRKDSNSEETKKKMTDYYHSLYNINPEMAYNMFFKISSTTSSSIDIKSLPQSVQDYLKKRAQGLMNKYNDHMKKQGY